MANAGKSAGTMIFIEDEFTVIFPIFGEGLEGMNRQVPGPEWAESLPHLSPGIADAAASIRAANFPSTKPNQKVMIS
jgi:hypothetical protein